MDDLVSSAPLDLGQAEQETRRQRGRGMEREREREVEQTGFDHIPEFRTRPVGDPTIMATPPLPPSSSIPETGGQRACPALPVIPTDSAGDKFHADSMSGLFARHAVYGVGGPSHVLSLTECGSGHIPPAVSLVPGDAGLSFPYHPCPPVRPERPAFAADMAPFVYPGTVPSTKGAVPKLSMTDSNPNDEVPGVDGREEEREWRKERERE
ncbi:hypothetical protein KIPB_005066 [Kipferlia bialata]|uniref:Uncharacterized protein n=1 Tax=Kipferlia bialata TaxID=797122 RepID=A0A391NNX1_9EUKA|nr:hypothetical protein KIPB_005066 [Kipferlia bialata]|eukprot:g5066.t1